MLRVFIHEIIITLYHHTGELISEIFKMTWRFLGHLFLFPVWQPWRFLCQSLQLLLSHRLWVWELQTVSPKLTHMAWVMHTVACLSDRWSLWRERCPDWMQYTGLLQAIPLHTVCVPKTTVPWCKCKVPNAFSCFFYLLVMVQILQVEVKSVYFHCTTISLSRIWCCVE